MGGVTFHHIQRLLNMKLPVFSALIVFVFVSACTSPPAPPVYDTKSSIHQNEPLWLDGKAWNTPQTREVTLYFCLGSDGTTPMPGAFVLDYGQPEIEKRLEEGNFQKLARQIPSDSPAFSLTHWREGLRDRGFEQTGTSQTTLTESGLKYRVIRFVRGRKAQE